MMTQIIPNGTLVEYEDGYDGYYLGWIVEPLYGSAGGMYGYTLMRLNGGTIPRNIAEVRRATLESELTILDGI